MSPNRFTSRSSARVAMAAVATASLVVVAACSEGGVAGNVAAPSLTPRLFTGPVLANASVATICVGSTSPNGTYTFVNSGFFAGANAVAPVGITTENVADGTTYTLVKTSSTPPCVDAIVRTGIPPEAEFDAFSWVTVTNTVTPAAVGYSSTTCEIDPGDAQTQTCDFTDAADVLATSLVNGSKVFMNAFHGSKTTFNFAPVAIGTPQFVVGDLASGLQLAAALKANKGKNGGNTLNFWGSQWWKNNPMSKFSDNGWPSFKGYATTAGTCGETWTSRVGNSPPPPATINDVINVIVTDKVWKDGPDLRGNILAIISVAQDGGYGPNPGHDGNGPMVGLLCGQIGQVENR